MGNRVEFVSYFWKFEKNCITKEINANLSIFKKDCVTGGLPVFERHAKHLLAPSSVRGAAVAPLIYGTRPYC